MPHTPPCTRRLAELTIWVLILGLFAAGTFLGGCASNQSTPEAPNDATESAQHWTDSNQAFQINIATPPPGGSNEVREAQLEGTEGQTPINSQLYAIDPTTGEPVPIPASALTARVLIINSTISPQIWADTASALDRAGTGATQTGGTIGDTTQEADQRTDVSPEVPVNLTPGN